MDRLLLDQIIETDYGQFDLVWNDGLGFDGDFDRFFAGQVNGLAGASSGEGLYVNLARRSGGSAVRIVLLDHPSDLDDQWEDVVEVSLEVPAGASLQWSTWAGEEQGWLEVPAGTYRVRVNARGRDAGSAGEFADETVDFYLIELWPSPVQPDSIVRVGSAEAAYWHREVGSRR